MTAYVLGLFILLACTLEAITGFGSVVIALSLGALLLPVESLLPVVVPLNIGLSGWLLWRHRRQVDRYLLLRGILPWMGLGTLLGYLAVPHLDAATLKRGFGALISLFAARELCLLRGADAGPTRPSWITRTLTLVAGISHGLFASGGPLLVFSLAGSPLDKAHLRATLLAVWFTLNSLLTLAFIADGRLQPALPQILTYAPLVALGVLLGERLHQRADPRQFRIAIYLLLLITGLLLLAPWSLV